MASEHNVTDDIVYDMISVQYHSLKAMEAYDKYIQDAHDHQDVVEFLRQCRDQDAERVEQSHQLIKGLMQSEAIRQRG